MLVISPRKTLIVTPLTFTCSEVYVNFSAGSSKKFMLDNFIWCSKAITSESYNISIFLYSFHIKIVTTQL